MFFSYQSLKRLPPLFPIIFKIALDIPGAKLGKNLYQLDAKPVKVALNKLAPSTLSASKNVVNVNPFELYTALLKN